MAGNLSGHVRATDQDGYFYASGSTDSRWRDIVTINAPGKKGQTGVATLNFKVTGESSFESNDQNCRTEVSASATVLNGSTWGIGRRKTIYPDGTFLGDDFLGAVQSMDFYFTYGEAFQLTVVLNTSSGTSGSSGGVGFADINAELIWLGFTNLRASDTITKVPDARSQSESEINYFRPIGVSYPTVTIRATPTELTEKPEQASTITISLNKPASKQLRVEFVYSGAATIQSDYTSPKPSYVYINKGSTQTTFKIRSKDDGLVEAPENVAIRLLPSIGYGVGLANTATVKIRSDD